MKKIKQLSFILLIFSVFVFSYPMTQVKQVFAQSDAHLSSNQCDASPACNPVSGTCCGQCDPGPACNANDPNAIPCCGSEEGNTNRQDFGQSQGFNQSLEQGGAHVSGNNISGGQCDANPACDPASGTCCNQCDPNPACVASDPHAIPCCSQHISGGDVKDPRDHRDTTFDDRPWREILKKCRQMKKSGRLSPEMRQECKAARKLKKESRR